MLKPFKPPPLIVPANDTPSYFRLPQLVGKYGVIIYDRLQAADELSLGAILTRRLLIVTH